VAWPADQKEINIQRQVAPPTNLDPAIAGQGQSEVTGLQKTYALARTVNADGGQIL